MIYKELDGFAGAMIKAYKNTSILKKLVKIIDYDNQKREFFQIAKRVLLPKEFFLPGNRYDNSILASDFTRAIVFGEKIFIVNYLTKLANKGEISSTKIKEFSYNEISEKIFDNVYAPTDIFIPIDWPYFNEVHNWIRERNAEYKDGLYIKIAHFKIKVHWSSKYTPFNNIVVLDKDGIRMIQKKFEDVEPPKWLGNILYRYGKGNPLIIDVAESEEPDKFNFYFRSIIAIDNIAENSAFVIKLPKVKKSK